MDKIHRPEKPKKEDLLKLYEVCNRIFNKKECFYESEKQIKEKEKI